MRNFTALLCAALLIFTTIRPAPARADATTCPLGYTVVFFNGVGNTFGDALTSMHATQAAIQETQSTPGDAYDSQDVKYEVAYNTTAAQAANAFDPVNTTILQDIAEVFVQRAQELDPSGNVGNNFFYMFWEWLDGPPQNYSNALGNNALTNNMFTRFVNAAVTTAAGVLGRLQGIQAPTASDYAEQEAELTADAAAGRRLLLVAHSQGNLFVNHAYTYILPMVGAPRVKVVHVAPASVTVNGDYVLSAKDAIINGLRLVNGFASIVDPNINPPGTSVDITGHGYSEIYLSSALVDGLSGQTDREVLKTKFLAALQALDAQQCSIAVSPASSNVGPAGKVTLTAALSPPANPANLLAINYKWTVTGTAGGTLFNPVANINATSVVTNQPSVAYTAADTATEGQADNVTVEIDISTASNNNATTAVLANTASNPAVIAIGGSAHAVTQQSDGRAELQHAVYGQHGRSTAGRGVLSMDIERWWQHRDGQPRHDLGAERLVHRACRGRYGDPECEHPELHWHRPCQRNDGHHGAGNDRERHHATESAGGSGDIGGIHCQCRYRVPERYHFHLGSYRRLRSVRCRP